MLSVVFAAIVVPAVAARDRSPLRGVKRLFLYLLVFDALYVAYLALVYVPRNVPPAP